MRMRAGRLDPRDLMAACLDRIAAREPEVKAFAALDPAQARAAKAEPGPLHGLPIGVKDVLDTADLPSGYGSPIWAGYRPRADAACVALARAAGCVVVGKTVTTEFAVRTPGPTANPRNTAHTPGGSSSGSAAAVADFMVPAAFATQTAGSIVRPAAYCGVVGYKPSYGTIPRLGMKVMSESLDTIGVIARTVADCGLFVGALTRRDLSPPMPDRAPRIGLCRSFVWSEAAPETAALFDDVAGRLSRAGATIVERDLPASFEALREAHPVVMNVESAGSMAWELTRHRDAISPALLERLDWGLAQHPDALDRARATCRACRREFPGVLDGIDILLTPSAAGEAPRGLGWTGDPVFNYVWTSLHVPCISLPAGNGPTGLPLGIQHVAGSGCDRDLLAWAAWVETKL